MYLVYQYNYIFCFITICSEKSTHPTTLCYIYLNCRFCVISLTLASMPSMMWPWHSSVFFLTTWISFPYVWFKLCFFPDKQYTSLFSYPIIFCLSDRIHSFPHTKHCLFKIQVAYKVISCVTFSLGLLLENLLPSFT